MIPRQRLLLSALLLVFLVPASACTHTSAAPAAAPVPALSPTPNRHDGHWAAATLRRLTLRQRVAQMVMVWSLGDYTSATDSTFALTRRAIVEDGVGGVIMS